jgi:hypothetical protein
MKRNMLVFGLLIVLGVVFTACSASPGSSSSSSTPVWQTVFFDDFNRANGTLGDLNWSLDRTNGLNTNLIISNNQAVIVCSAPSPCPTAWFTNQVNNTIIRISSKIITPSDASQTYFVVGCRTTGWQSSGYQLGLFGSALSSFNFMLGYTSGNTNIITNLQNNTLYNIELIIDNFYLTAIIFNSNMTTNSVLTYNDTNYSWTNGKIWITGGYNTIVDDFKIEKFE